ncbi:MAG: Phosphoglycolate phosphatase, partial [uncultured Microvirga sp.]
DLLRPPGRLRSRRHARRHGPRPRGDAEHHPGPGGRARPAARSGERPDRRRRARLAAARFRGCRGRTGPEPARGALPPLPGALRRQHLRRDAPLSRRRGGARPARERRLRARHLHQQDRGALRGAAHRARRRPSLRGDLRPRHFSVFQARPPPPHPDGRARRRRPAPGRDGGRFALRHRGRQGRRDPGRRRDLRLHRSPGAGIAAGRGDRSLRPSLRRRPRPAGRGSRL